MPKFLLILMAFLDTSRLTKILEGTLMLCDLLTVRTVFFCCKKQYTYLLTIMNRSVLNEHHGKYLITLVMCVILKIMRGIV